MTDVNGRVYVIDKSFVSNPISFRKQVFGIMTACGNYNLISLATDKPVSLNIVCYYLNGLKILENENEECFFMILVKMNILVLK